MRKKLSKHQSSLIWISALIRLTNVVIATTIFSVFVGFTPHQHNKKTHCEQSCMFVLTNAWMNLGGERECRSCMNVLNACVILFCYFAYVCFVIWVSLWFTNAYTRGECASMNILTLSTLFCNAISYIISACLLCLLKAQGREVCWLSELSL